MRPFRTPGCPPPKDPPVRIKVPRRVLREAEAPPVAPPRIVLRPGNGGTS
jgi:hypothetical protein